MIIIAITFVRHMDLKCLKATLKIVVLAIHKVGVSEELSSINEVLPQHITSACAAASVVMLIKDDPHFWTTVQNELLAALSAIQKVEHSLCHSGELPYANFDIVKATAITKVHLGLAMAMVLCPSLLDPLTISATEHHYLFGIVSC